jgi:hypothetical protein
MFETLIVSRTIERPNGHAGLMALIFHFLLLALALQSRSEQSEGKARHSEAIPLIFPSVPPAIPGTRTAAPARVAPFRAPSVGALKVPALPNLESS